MRPEPGACLIWQRQLLNTDKNSTEDIFMFARLQDTAVVAPF